MSSEAPLNCSVVGSTVVPHFLEERDHPWLRSLLEERERFVGRPQRELDARLRAPLPCEAPPGKKRLAIHALAGLAGSQRHGAVPPRQARSLVFREAARTPGPPRRSSLGWPLRSA